MTISKYRRYAAECLLISDGATDPQNRISLLAMAQAWLKLAQRAEQEGAADPCAQPPPTEAFSSAEATIADAAGTDRTMALMPLYQFHIRDSDHFEDHEGVNLPDDLSAREHALGIVRELQKADEASWRQYTMEVRRDGHLVWEIPFEVSPPSG